MGEINPFKMLEGMSIDLMNWWAAYDSIEPMHVHSAQTAAVLRSLEEEPKDRVEFVSSILGFDV